MLYSSFSDYTQWHTGPGPQPAPGSRDLIGQSDRSESRTDWPWRDWVRLGLGRSRARQVPEPRRGAAASRRRLSVDSPAAAPSCPGIAAAARAPAPRPLGPPGSVGHLAHLGCQWPGRDWVRHRTLSDKFKVIVTLSHYSNVPVTCPGVGHWWRPGPAHPIFELCERLSDCEASPKYLIKFWDISG